MPRRSGGPVRRLLLTLSLLVVVGLSTAGSASAYAFLPDVYVPWPFDKVTYREFGPEKDSPLNQEALSTAVNAFNSANERYAAFRGIETYYRLVRVPRGRPNVRFVFETPGRSEEDRDPCAGVAWPGWDFDGTTVHIEADDRCDLYARTLLMAHEIGHVFLLDDTASINARRNPDLIACSALNFNTLRPGMPPELRYLTSPVYNSRGRAIRGQGRPWRTSECPAPRRTSSGRWTGREYWRSPFTADDQEGFWRADESGGTFDFSPFRFPEEICRSSNSEYVRTFTLCQFEYDCRGAAAREDTAPSNVAVSTRTDANGKYPWLRNCQERPYSTVDRQDRLASPPEPSAWLNRLPPGFTFNRTGP